MDYKQIEYFLALARIGSVSGAADFLHLSQPALSKSIKNLEKEVGVQLFDRLGNRVRINKNGQEFYAYAKRSVQSLRSGLETVRQNRYDILGELTIVSYTALDSITECVTEYRQLNPKIRLSLLQSGLGEGEDLSQADLVLRAAPLQEVPDDDVWVGTKLFTEEFRVMVSPNCREFPADQQTLDIGLVKEENFVSIRPEYPYFIDNTVDFCKMAGFVPRIAYQTNDFLIKCRLMGEGYAVGFLPECCVKTAQRLYPDLRSFAILGNHTARSIWLMRRGESQNTEIARDFWEFAREWYKNT